MVLALYPLAILLSFVVGALPQCLILIFLGYRYNDLGGADAGPLICDLINACGFVRYDIGSLHVALGVNREPSSSALVSAPLLLWQRLGIIGGIVISTVHTQNMYDQARDALRGRRTLPLCIGDWGSRLTMGIGIIVWTFMVLRFWQISGFMESMSILPVCLLGGTVAFRTLVWRSVEYNRHTFLLWNLWPVAMYLLPVLRSG